MNGWLPLVALLVGIIGALFFWQYIRRKNWSLARAIQRKRKDEE
jgi:hypothetical protein